MLVQKKSIRRASLAVASRFKTTRVRAKNTTRLKKCNKEKISRPLCFVLFCSVRAVLLLNASRVNARTPARLTQHWFCQLIRFSAPCNNTERVTQLLCVQRLQHTALIRGMDIERCRLLSVLFNAHLWSISFVIFTHNACINPLTRSRHGLFCADSGVICNIL